MANSVAASRGRPPLDYLNERALLDAIHNKGRGDDDRISFRDSKDFVDMPILCGDIGVVRDKLLSASDSSTVLEENFDLPGSDLRACEPGDWSNEGAERLLTRTRGEGSTQAMVRHIHSCWPELCKTSVADVGENPGRHTLLRMPHKMFVPGSRFREQYYWDSYFTLQGLLVSDMLESAIHLIENLLFCVERYGYVPNGTRSYYLGRTQPPLLSEMLVDLWNWVVTPTTTNNNSSNKNKSNKKRGEPSMVERVKALLEKSLPLLVKEHAFVTSRERTVTLARSGGQRAFDLVRYYAGTACPRPESHKEDVSSFREWKSRESGKRCSDGDGDGDGEREEEEEGNIYKEIATMAESGWDFSSRWLRDPNRLETSRITRMLPVDLNTIVARMEGNVSQIAEIAGREEICNDFRSMSRIRFDAIDAILWDEVTNQWRDFVLDENPTLGPGGLQKSVSGKLSQSTCASNWLPLWGLPREKSKAAIASLESSGLLQEGGLATSLCNSGHQWDYPNAWAPLQYLIHQGLLSTEADTGKALAETIARNFLKNVQATFSATGKMHEKYNAERVGHYGGGGEYVPQTGFGWTNGVVLKFLAEPGKF